MELNPGVEAGRSSTVKFVGGRYPFLPACACGHRFRGYVADHAARDVLEDHLKQCGAVDRSRPDSGAIGTFTDQLGRPIAVGARVVPIGTAGAVLWSRTGRVVGLGRTLVHVQWASQHYNERRRYHAVRSERLRLLPASSL